MPKAFAILYLIGMLLVVAALLWRAKRDGITGRETRADDPQPWTTGQQAALRTLARAPLHFNTAPVNRAIEEIRKNRAMREELERMPDLLPIRPDIPKGAKPVYGCMRTTGQCRCIRMDPSLCEFSRVVGYKATA